MQYLCRIKTNERKNKVFWRKYLRLKAANATTLVHHNTNS